MFHRSYVSVLRFAALFGLLGLPASAIGATDPVGDMFPDGTQELDISDYDLVVGSTAATFSFATTTPIQWDHPTPFLSIPKVQMLWDLDVDADPTTPDPQTPLAHVGSLAGESIGLGATYYCEIAQTDTVTLYEWNLVGGAWQSDVVTSNIAWEEQASGGGSLISWEIDLGLIPGLSGASAHGLLLGGGNGFSDQAPNVPEPASAVLLLVGGGWAGRRARRR